MNAQKGSGIYNVIAIGAGSAGLITSAAISGLGGRVALIEKAKMGGDCLNYGCVPSKGLISSARLVHSIREGEKWGLDRQDPQFEFTKVFESMRSRRAKIEPNDSQERFEKLGVDVFRGEARFVSPHEIEVDGLKLRAKNFVITAGSRARIPDIEGINDVPYFTNETIFDKLDRKPQEIIIIGGGPIGCELGQVFNRLGVKVYLLQRGPHILPKEDPDVADFMRQQFEAEGIHMLTGRTPRKIVYREGKHHLTVESSQPDGSVQSETIVADVFLAAAGRIPNIEKLNLEAAGVAYSERGIRVNKFLQTSQSHIYAAGDIVGFYQFTHLADYHARLVVENIIRRMILPFRVLNKLTETDYGCLPWATYTSPEIGQVGLNETAAKKQGIPYDLYKIDMGEVDRAIVERHDKGFLKVLTQKGSDKILGATLLSEHGGDLIHEFILAMKHNIGLGQMAKTVHIYPTFSEVARKVGDAYNKTLLTPKKHSFLKWLFKWQLKG